MKTKEKVKEALKIGYIRLYRIFENWQWYSDVSCKVLYLHCLLQANYNTKKWQNISIPKGSFVSSVSKLSIDTGLSIQQVRTALNKLKSTSDLTYKTTNKYTVVTVCNYCLWQELERKNNKQINKQINKQLTNEQQTINNQITTTNNTNNKRDYITYNLSQRETEILINFSKENVKDKRKYRAYFNKILETGDYKEILAELKEKERQKSKLAAIKEAEENERNPEIKDISEYSDTEIVEILRNYEQNNGLKNPFIKLAENEAKKRGLKI